MNFGREGVLKYNFGYFQANWALWESLLYSFRGIGNRSKQLVGIHLHPSINGSRVLIKRERILHFPRFFVSFNPVYCLGTTDSITPCPIQNSSTVNILFLHEHLVLPSLHIRRVHEPTRLHTEAASGSSGRNSSTFALHFGDIDVLSSIELECWSIMGVSNVPNNPTRIIDLLGALNLQMDLSGRVIRLD